MTSSGRTTLRDSNLAMIVQTNSPILNGGSATTSSGSTTLFNIEAKLSWYELTFGDSVEAMADSMSPPSISPPSTPRQACLSEEIAVEDDDDVRSTVSNQLVDWIAHPLAANNEYHAPRDVHAVEDCSISRLGSALEVLSVGSALHRAGTCIPCKFLRTTLGCYKGHACKRCHHPHVEASRNSKRRQRRDAKMQLEEFARAISPHASMPNTSSSLHTSFITRNSFEATAVVNGDVKENTDSSTVAPIQLANARLADNNEDHALHDVHAAEDSSRSSIGSTLELLSVRSAMHHIGTCIPCKFINIKSGCEKGRKCKCCHHPHEDATRNSTRRRRHIVKNKVEEFKSAMDVAAPMSDILTSPIRTPVNTSDITEETSLVNVDVEGLVVSNIVVSNQLANLPVDPPVDDNEDHVPRDSPTVEVPLESSIGSTTELLSLGSAMHHWGTCIPCKFISRRSGCSQGHKCKSCHCPHEKVTRKSNKSQRRIDHEEATRLLWSVM